MDDKKKVNQAFIRRRKKEYLSSIIISFLKINKCFDNLYRDFFKHEARFDDFLESGFSDRINKLCDMSIQDLKEKTDFLFRRAEVVDPYDSEICVNFDDLRNILAEVEQKQNNKIKKNELYRKLSRSLLNQSIDCNINKIYRKLMVLKENLYELEFYRFRYIHEHQILENALTLFRTLEHAVNENEENELHHIVELDKLSQKILYDTRNHTKMILELCNSLFKETAVVLFYKIQDSVHNEVLILNIVENLELVESLYGEGSGEKIFLKMFEGTDYSEGTGIERAHSFLRNNCGNISGIGDLALKG